MRRAVLFDYGNTLADLWPIPEWPAILGESIAVATEHLRGLGRLTVPPDLIEERTQAERGERGDAQVRPLEGRLRRIFDLPPEAVSDEALKDLCRAFMEPQLRRAQPAPDAMLVLEALRSRGLRLGILSNSPWGCPGWLWRLPIERDGFAARVDDVVLCVDVGWRKPAPALFEHALARLGVTAGEALFVGDDPRYDTSGARGVGMAAVLLDREGIHGEVEEHRIGSLAEVISWV